VNSFDSKKLLKLFSGLRLTSTSFVGTTKEATTALSAFLMDLSGNPWGTYDQEEACIHCGTQMKPPESRQPWQRGLSGIAARINRLQTHCTKPHGKWIHLMFSKG
jgi:hypothetical protein